MSDTTRGVTLRYSARRAFSLVELLIIIMLLAIVAGLALPTLGDTDQLKLREAARLLAADIEYAQAESIAHAVPDEQRIIKVDVGENRYWIGTNAAPDTPIDDLTRPLHEDEDKYEDYLIAYGQGRALGLSGVEIQAVDFGRDAYLRFDQYGTPLHPDGTLRTSDATISLTAGGSTLNVVINHGTGEVTIP